MGDDLRVNAMDAKDAQQAPLGQNEYRCAVCQGVFEKGWTDEEAKEELGTTFPGIGTDDCDLVCDDCFKKMGF